VSNPETVLLQEIRLALAQIPGVILFRNAIGHDSRAHVDYGIMNPGGPDTIGWVTQKVGERADVDMAQFLGIEVKTATGVVSDEQRQRIHTIRAAGGLAGIARSVEDAKRIIKGEILD
jgi:hypothetical protein